MKSFVYLLFLFVCVSLSIYLVYTGMTINMGSERLKKEEDTLANLKTENKELLNEIEYRKTDEFVINEARKILNYGFEGEYMVVIPKTVDEPIENENKQIIAEDTSETDKEEESEEILTNQRQKDFENFSNLARWIKAFGF